MESAISSAVNNNTSHFLDASALGVALLGDAMASNMILLGYAWQKGLLPLQWTSLEHAITLNAVAVDLNMQAFQWGRQYAVDPDTVAGQARLKPSVEQPTEDNIDQAISYRFEELIAYQNVAYAERYQSLIDKVRDIESKIVGDGELLLTEQVARNYFKLLAYKDEYEVARLFADGEFQRSLAEQFEGKIRLRFHLAPPLLSRKDPDTGQLIKREFGGWMLPVFKLVARLKFLRGGMFDVFGRSNERKMERELIKDYEGQIDRILTKLSSQKLDLAVEIAGLPYFIRGFGHVKEANIKIIQRRSFNLMKKYDEEQIEIVKIQEVETVPEL
jgi:indolepyruvate ferredoxin oxidoreductase